MERRTPKKGDIYQHFKGKKYKILDMAVCTETGEDMVIFETMDGKHRVYASFLEKFLSPLDTSRYHGNQKYRFELCRNEDIDPVMNLKRHGNTTALILEFLDLEEDGERIRFLQRHQSEIDSRFLTAASESLDFAETADTVEERYSAVLRYLKTRAKFESRRLR